MLAGSMRNVALPTALVFKADWQTLCNGLTAVFEQGAKILARPNFFENAVGGERVPAGPVFLGEVDGSA
jgi:hypothetical protein